MKQSYMEFKRIIEKLDEKININKEKLNEAVDKL